MLASAFSMSGINTGLEDSVNEGILLGSDLEVIPGVSAGVIGSMRIVTSSNTQANAPTSNCLGVSVQGSSITGSPFSYIGMGSAAIKCGQANIAKGTQIVAAPGGVAAAFNATTHTMMNAVRGATTDDFTNTHFTSSGSTFGLATTVSVVAAKGDIVTIGYLDLSYAYQTVNITLDASDSSVQVMSTVKATAIVSMSVGTGFTGTLVLKDLAGNTIISITNPVAGGYVYGSIACATSTSALGQRVKITSTSGAITGNLVVVGTINGSTVHEVVNFSSASSAYTVNGYSAVAGLLIGDDGAVQGTYTIIVEANTDSQVVGYAGTALVANTYGLIIVNSAVAVNPIRTSENLVNTAGAGTYLAAIMMAGIIKRDGTNADRADAFDTAVNLVAAITNPYVGLTFDVLLVNITTANKITPSAGVGGTSYPGTLSALQVGKNMMYRVRLTGIVSGSEAYDIFELGYPGVAA